MARPMILSCHLAGEKLNKLKFVCMKCGILLKPVSADDERQPIGALCGISEPIESPAEAAPLSREMIVFCHMDNAQVNRFLTTARQLRLAPIDLKAVLTPTNAAWTAQQLQQELAEERAAVMQGSTADHTEENT